MVYLVRSGSESSTRITHPKQAVLALPDCACFSVAYLAEEDRVSPNELQVSLVITVIHLMQVCGNVLDDLCSRR